MGNQKVLIPVLFPDPTLYPLADSHLQGLDGFEIVLFGYWKLTHGETAESARDSHETEAEAVLYDMAAHLSRAGAKTEIQLHFGPGHPDDRELQSRISDESDADAVLITDRLTAFNNVLVPLRDDRHQAQIVDFVGRFDTDNIFVLELHHVTPDEASVDAATETLERVQEQLPDSGLSPADIETTVEIADDPVAAIVERARNHNIVVTGQPDDQGEENTLFSRISDDVHEQTETPVVIVRD
jgi:nucleotide-binding universal stress UspA family protein